MNAYVIHITLQTGVDLQAANNNLKDAISAIEGLPATAVEVFYAALGAATTTSPSCRSRNQTTR